MLPCTGVESVRFAMKLRFGGGGDPLSCSGTIDGMVVLFVRALPGVDDIRFCNVAAARRLAR